ncbi:MAG: ribosomal RNA small subunit methyltransferase A [Euryarchaeota archaeon]|nr:ribosomal RNA small subunit methyltransferase A [Euryarchaeota archaeon]
MKPSEIKTILAEIGASPARSRGQNFLIDEKLADRQIEYARLSSEDIVLEVGPGLGVLTKRLAASANKVIAIETDAKLASYLLNNLPPNVELIKDDALDVEFPIFNKFVSNLPYSISSPIIFKLLENSFERGVVMLQKEFADRMVALPGGKNYSRLTVNVYYRAECRILENVSSSCFWPAPRVDSAVVELVPRAPPFHVKDEKFFFHLVELLFQNRRKKIGTILKMRSLITAEQRMQLPYVDDRVETLVPEQIGELSDKVIELRTS